MVPKQYYQTYSNPIKVPTATGLTPQGSYYVQNSTMADGSISKEYNILPYNYKATFGYGVGIKLGKKKYWTTHFEGNYLGFRYATCYVKGIYTTGHRPLSF